MAVPAHDMRDHEFASKYNLPICGVVMPNDQNISSFDKAYSGDGTVINSSNLTAELDINGLSNK